MITYSFDRALSAEDVHRLLLQTGWAATRTVDEVQQSLNHSLNLGAWDGDRLVGYARVLTDDRFRALIEDVVVDEAYRGQGIGRGLVEHLLERLAHVEELMLGCSDQNVPFYKKFGFDHKAGNTMNIWRGPELP